MVFTAFCLVHNILALLRFLCTIYHFRLTYRTGYRHSHLWLALGNLFGFQLWHERKLTCMHRRAFLRCENIVHMRFAIPFCGQCSWQSSFKIVRVLATRVQVSATRFLYLRIFLNCAVCWVTRWLDYSNFYSSKHTFHCGYGHFHEICHDFCYNKWNPLKPQKPNPIRIILKIEQKFAT